MKLNTKREYLFIIQLYYKKTRYVKLQSFTHKLSLLVNYIFVKPSLY
jgi:hypothetical protein